MKSHLSFANDLPFRRRHVLLLAGLWSLLYGLPAQAQIRMDASLGGATQALSGPNYLIPQTLGKLSGNNLFHSFQTFSLKSGESALFTTTSSNIANVISRVTGGEASTIAGALRLRSAGSGTPGFFLINPAGITFAAGASVDVPGAFYVSTANYVKFADGNFYADTAQPSTLSSVAPEAFGFLAGGRATVQSVGTHPVGTPGQPVRSGLFVGTDKAIQIVASDVLIDSSVIGNESGDVRIVAVGQPSQETLVALSGSHPAASGELTIRNGGQINSSTKSNKDVGSVLIHAGDIMIDKGSANRDTGIISQAYEGASGRVGQVSIVASGDLSLRHGALISVKNEARASQPATIDPGRLTIMARNITLSDGSTITTESRGNVDASSIHIAATGSQPQPLAANDFDSPTLKASGDLQLTRGGAINGNTYLSGQGAAIDIKTGRLALDGEGQATMIVASTLKANPGQTTSQDATGDGGNIDITAQAVRLTNGGQLQTVTSTRGKAGTIRMQAGGLEIDGQNGKGLTGIFAAANPGSGGQAGTILLDLADGDLTVTRRGGISGQNDATVTTQQLAALTPSAVRITAGNVTLKEGALISASTSGNVEASTIDLQSHRNITLDGSAALQGSTSGAGHASSINVRAGGDLTLGSRAFINGNTSRSGNAAAININAANITLDGQGDSATISSEAIGQKDTNGSGGLIHLVTPGQLNLSNGGQIRSSTNSAGNSGRILLEARDIDIDGHDNVRQTTGIINTTTHSGDSEEIAINASSGLQVRRLGEINASAYGANGRAGAIRIDSGTLLIDGMKEFQGNITLPDGSQRAVNGFKSSTISSEAGSNSAGMTGDVTINARQSMTVSNGGKVTVSNLASQGQATQINALPANKKPNLTIQAGSLTVDQRGGITASTDGNVDASALRITTQGDLTIGANSNINGNTSGSGKGASITIQAATLTLDGQGSIASISSESMPHFAPGTSTTGAAGPAAQDMGGEAGSVDIAASRIALNNGGQIKTSTSTSGKAGKTTIVADNVSIDGANNSAQVLTGIASTTQGKGNSGEISISAAQDFSLLRLGQISASTNAAGRAGNIGVQAQTIRIDGRQDTDRRISASSISAEAGPTSSGQTGNLTITAQRAITITNGGRLSTQNAANVSPAAASQLNGDQARRTRLAVSAPDITLIDSQITTASTGNINASDIDIRYTNTLHLDPSTISTSANTGDGGAIDIQGGRLMILDKSVVSTSVYGTIGFNGNPASGGDIRVTTDNLLLKTGFIQANTAASNASGGNVVLTIRNLVPSGNTLFVGGQTAQVFRPDVFGFNVIQAAAPTGLSGVIQISAPTLDLAGVLSGLDAKRIDSGGLGRSPCQASEGSSFVQLGRGGFAPSARGLLGPQATKKSPAGQTTQKHTDKPIILSQVSMECSHQ